MRRRHPKRDNIVQHWWRRNAANLTDSEGNGGCARFLKTSTVFCRLHDALIFDKQFVEMFRILQMTFSTRIWIFFFVFFSFIFFLKMIAQRASKWQPNGEKQTWNWTITPNNHCNSRESTLQWHAYGFDKRTILLAKWLCILVIDQDSCSARSFRTVAASAFQP